MSKPFKVSRATAVVDVTAVSPGDDPTIRLVYHAENSRGLARQFVRQVAVRDAVLFRYLQASVEVGDQIEATTVNEWYDTGYISYLADFKTVPAVEQGVIAKNGTLNIVEDNIVHFTLPPARDPNTKIEH